MLPNMTADLEPPMLAGIPIRQFTVDEYHRMAELGFFAGERVELLFGAIVPKLYREAERDALIARQREELVADVEPPTLGGEPIRLVRRSEFERLAELGFFKDERVELVFGAVVPMPPIDEAHVESTDRLMKFLITALGDRARVSCQAPIAASSLSAPQPDIYVRPAHDGWLKSHPNDAQLVIEVARSSLRYDRTTKAKLYAVANVDEYWIVNHNDGVIEVYRDRQPDGSWRSCTVAQRGETVSPLAYPDVTIAVDDVVPPVGF
jgi:Uma2 family endonuclease